MKKLTREWIHKAEDDLIVAEREYKHKRPIYDAVCFHSQQCVEKYMKAVLQENDVEFEKTHDLDVLLESCKTFIPELEHYKLAILNLSSFAVEIRYPGVRATKNEATECISAMRKVMKIMRNYFRTER